MATRWLVGIVCAWAGSRQAAAGAPVGERVAELRIEGNRAIARDALAPALALRAGEPLEPYLVTADADRIRAAYVKRGYFAVQVTPRIERARIVVFAIDEGRRAVARVEITGLPPEVPAAAARALVELADGAPFDYAAYDAAKQPLATLVEEAGYAHVAVTATALADPGAATATLRYEVQPGVRCTFGEIRVLGTLEPSLLAAVIARVQFATGDRYSVAAMAEAQAEISELGRFSTVQLVWDQTGSGSVIDVDVKLRDATRHEVHLGFGVGYEPETYELRGRAGASYVPAAAPLTTLAIDLRVAPTLPHSGDTSDLELKLRGLASLQRLDLLRPRLRGELEAGADYQVVEAYTWTGVHVRLGASSPLGARWLQLRIGWQLERVAYQHPAAELELPESGGQPATRRLGIEGAQLVGAYQVSLIADLRDDPIEPHRGVYFDVRAALGSPLALGELSYLQLTPELRGYLPLGRTVVAGRVRVGAILGDVPAIARYYSGGTSGQRGFSERRLSPTVPALCPTSGGCVVVGGAGLIETGLELRRPLGSPWGLPVGANLFLDGADVTDAPRALDPANLYWAAGVGLWGKLYDLKIRVDVGYLLNRTDAPDGWSRLAVHLGIGETF